jgi:hypothetical protein
MGGVLVGLSFMGPSRSGRFLVFSIAEESTEDSLGERFENLGQLSSHIAGKRMAPASGMVPP